MEYKKIEQLVYNNSLIDRNDFKSRYAYNLEMDKLIIENLIRCINKNVKLEMDETEFARIYKIYLKLIRRNYPISVDFIYNVANLSTKKLDYLGIIQEITE